MSDLLSLAIQFGGRERQGEILVPAKELMAFLAAAHEQAIVVPFIECLYLNDGLTEPSLELSWSDTRAASWETFSDFARDAAETAASRAATKSAEAVFVVGP